MIIDKVISQRSLDTLQVLGLALVAVTIFEGLLGTCEPSCSRTPRRIDMRLGAEVIDRLEASVGYFDAGPWELGTRIAELEKIRNFLTGKPPAIIDTAFSVIYILVMALWLGATLIALLVLPIR